MKYKQTEMKYWRSAHAFAQNCSVLYSKTKPITKEYQPRLIRSPIDHDTRRKKKKKKRKERTEKQQGPGHTCIRNSWRARFGGREDFLSACLKVCTRRSAAPLVAGWYGAPVKCVIPRSLHLCWDSSEVKVGALSVTSVWGNPKWAKSSSSKSRVALVDVDDVGWMHGYLE